MRLLPSPFGNLNHIKMENKSIPPFYVGQRVVCVKTHSQQSVVKDREYIVSEIIPSFCGCRDFIVRVAGVYSTSSKVICITCGIKGFNAELLSLLGADLFAPITESMQPVTFEKIAELNPVSCN